MVTNVLLALCAVLLGSLFVGIWMVARHLKALEGLPQRGEIAEAMSAQRDRISESLKYMDTTLIESLSKVHERLGVVKGLADGVKDIRGMLGGVKTRGILGEYQLEAILQEVLDKSQYVSQAVVVPGSAERVDFAIRLPGGEWPVYLPVDSKFPGEIYARLKEAVLSEDKAALQAAKKALRAAVLAEAKSIQEKYVSPPHTTDFAVMFFPVEGLYAEVVNMGLLEELHRKHQVTVAGPSTLVALLSALRMGFRTLAIEQRSVEAWKALESAKKEFCSFEEGLDKVRERLAQADEELEKLVGARSRAINRSLKAVSSQEEETEG